MAVKHITFAAKNEPELIALVNKLAEKQGRKPHDTVKRALTKIVKAELALIERNERESRGTELSHAG